MKYVIAIIILAASLGYFSKEVWGLFSEKKAEKVQSQMEQSLFPFIIQAQPQENIIARPMWVEETMTILKVYCEYLGDKSPEAREQVRNEMVLIVKKWSETKEKKYNFVYVIFTDEVISPEKK